MLYDLWWFFNNNLSSFGPLCLFRVQSIFQCVSSMNTGWTFCFQYYANVDIAIFLASLFCSELAPFPRWCTRYVAGWFIMLIIISLLSVVNCIALWQNHVPLYCGFRWEFLSSNLEKSHFPFQTSNALSMMCFVRIHIVVTECIYQHVHSIYCG